MISGKIWGKTESLLVTPLIEIHRIFINKGCVCSMHKHEFKWNMFYVVSGELAIEVEKNDYELVDTTIIKSGEWTSVRPNEYHRFRSITDVECLEIYYLEPLTTDIVRKNVGGVLENK